MLSLEERIRKFPAIRPRCRARSRVVETEGRLCLGDGDLAGDFGNVLVKFSPDVVVVAEDECLL